MKINNLLDLTNLALTEEHFDSLITTSRFKLERIVSLGHTTPDGQWYDQDQDEWVMLLSGKAKLQFQDPEREIDLQPGDHLNLPAKCKHRVSWTDPDHETVWLALHYQADSKVT